MSVEFSASGSLGTSAILIEQRWWFICFVVSGKERKFRRKLAKDGIINFSPTQRVEVKKRIKNGFKTIIQNSFVFSGYVFVLGDHLGKILDGYWKYLIGIVRFGEVIGRIKHSIIDELLLMQSRNAFDKLHEGKKKHNIKIGDIVTIDDEYKGGIYSGTSWLVLFIQRKRLGLLNGTTICKISVSFVKKKSDRGHIADSNFARSKRRPQKKKKRRAAPKNLAEPRSLATVKTL